jgi:hypothetical protein
MQLGRARDTSSEIALGSPNGDGRLTLMWILGIPGVGMEKGGADSGSVTVHVSPCFSLPLWCSRIGSQARDIIGIAGLVQW